MEHPRRAAALVTGAAGLLAASACVVGTSVGQVAGPAASPPVRASSAPSAEFVAPLHVPAPPAGVLGPAGGEAADGGAGVLGPEDVITPTPTVPLRAVIRPA
ncbi:hypothetical protein AB2L28_13690 [Kineococcus sp. TBRC 1896]|uniref:Uncharacterized protein n=1 Tax=Kineococcus mangrovi TaxID=1660183 RepID=A0ABV4I6G2_9ACTN